MLPQGPTTIMGRLWASQSPRLLASERCQVSFQYGRQTVVLQAVHCCSKDRAL